MENKTEFLEVAPGNKSNSRRIAWCAFWAGLVFAQQVLAAGLYVYITKDAPESGLLAIGGATASVFTGIAGSAMIFAFGQKSNETKPENK